MHNGRVTQVMAQGCKDFSVSASQPMWCMHQQSEEWKPDDHLNDTEKGFDKIKHPFMIKKKKTSQKVGIERT